MHIQPENRYGLPKALEIIRKSAWALIWLILCFQMLIYLLCGVNFIAVGIVSLFVDLGNWGPRLNGDLVPTMMEKIVFVVFGIILGMSSVGFFRLGSRMRFGAAVIFFAAAQGVFFTVGWTTGIHNISGGVGYMGYSEKNR